MTEYEYRVVCAHLGEATRHSSHKWDKRGKDRKKKAAQSVTDLNHHREMQSSHFYRNEAPYRVQVREVGAWRDNE